MLVLQTNDSASEIYYNNNHSIQTNSVLHFFHHNGALQAPLQWMDGPVSTQTVMLHMFVFTSID